MNIFWDNIDAFFRNPVVLPTFVAWLSAQLCKFVIDLVRFKKVDFTRIVGSGGMPSTHTAFVTALAMTLGLQQGFDSAVFALALGLSLIVMTDAAGVRQAAGKQARVLNEIVELMQHHSDAVPKKLKELLGHTPLQVFAGAAWGVVTALLFAW